MKLYLDLDGTLIESGARLHALFVELVGECQMTFPEYWRLKRGGKKNADLLRDMYCYTDARLHSFETAWLAEIERESLLATDAPYEGVTEHLRALAQRHELYLVTARQKPEMVAWQVRRFGWEGIFREVLVTGGVQDKFMLISATRPQAGDFMPGDTGLDIMTGKKLGLTTVGVANGFTEKERLATYQPDLLVECFTEFDPD